MIGGDTSKERDMQGGEGDEMKTTHDTGSGTETDRFSDDEVHALLGAYALNAVDDVERRHVEAYVAASDDAQEELSGLQAAAAALGAIAEVSPPPRLRGEVLAAVSRTPQLTPLSPTPEREPAPVTVASLGEHRRRRASGTVWALGLAAAVLAVATVGIGAWGLQQQQKLQSSQAVAADVATVVTAPDARSISAASSTGGRGAVVFSAGLGRAAFVGDGLAPLASDKTYQVWLLDDAGKAASAGLLATPDGQGALALPGTAGAAKAVAVSVEPSGGSTAPTTTPVLIAYV